MYHRTDKHRERLWVDDEIRRYINARLHCIVGIVDRFLCFVGWSVLPTVRSVWSRRAPVSSPTSSSWVRMDSGLNCSLASDRLGIPRAVTTSKTPTDRNGWENNSYRPIIKKVFLWGRGLFGSALSLCVNSCVFEVAEQTACDDLIKLL